MSVAADEEWVKSAMLDDAMVVDLLVRLNHTSRTAPPPRIKRSAAALSLEWSIRQRRSKSGSVNPKKPPHRASPTTPISWSGATSVSGGSEESSRPPAFELPNTARSKVNGDSDKTPSKRSRKKKTLTQLKEEESLLVKEKIELNREITAIRMKLEKQRATNESLNRIKLELQPHSEKVAMSSQEEYASGQPTPCIIGKNSTLQSSLEQNEEATFFLPDLNMPFDDSSSDVICGVN